MIQRFVCAVLVMASHVALAAPLQTFFFVQGNTHTIHVETSLVARQGPSTVTKQEWSGLKELGYSVVALEQYRPKLIPGHPIFFSESKEPAILTNEILVKLRNNQGRQKISKAKGYLYARDAGFIQDLVVASFVDPISGLRAANKFATDEDFVYAHPNFKIRKVFRTKFTDEPSDTFFSSQWHLKNTGQSGGSPGADINIFAAWEITKGSPDTVVGVIDSGFQTNHPDLSDAFVVNNNEQPANGIDDDNNGYVDDHLGWNFWEGTNDVSRTDIVDHGTAVAGLIGARENGDGVTGVCPQCKILPIVLGFDPLKDAEAVHYAWRNGAAIISNSWGYPVGTPETDVLVEALATARTEGRHGKGTIILFAMNNTDKDDCKGNTPDISSLPSVIAVSSSSDKDVKVRASAWGDCMEILGPSKESNQGGIATADSLGTRGYNNGRFPNDLPNLDYTNNFGGTSAATPIVSGTIALMLTVNPELTRDEAIDLLLRTADKINPTVAAYNTNGFSKKYGYGRVNTGKAVRAAEEFKRYSVKRTSLQQKYL